MVPYSKQTLKRSLQMYDELERVRRKILQPKKLLLEVRKTRVKQHLLYQTRTRNVAMHA